MYTTRKFPTRVTIPNDKYVGQIFKIEMMKADYKYTIVNMGAHLFTDELNNEVTIRMFNGNTSTYGMGHTRSAPATIDEITTFLNDYWYGDNSKDYLEAFIGPKKAWNV